MIVVLIVVNIIFIRIWNLNGYLKITSIIEVLFQKDLQLMQQD